MVEHLPPMESHGHGCDLEEVQKVQQIDQQSGELELESLVGKKPDLLLAVTLSVSTVVSQPHS